MTEQTQVELARAIATAAHAGQVDKLGVDYINHPARVAARLDPVSQEVEHCAAWLHDVLEDTSVTSEELAARGIRPEIIEVVELMTRDHDEYYERIRENPAALAVKLADIADNTDPARTALLDDVTRERLAAKYASALQLLRGI
jgi:(p)ppGpp synthase/HD superfamily hydrolase